jgi:transcription initiation factor TFIIIB Brf1 subunit/transcription initiation factor TFIIB
LESVTDIHDQLLSQIFDWRDARTPNQQLAMISGGWMYRANTGALHWKAEKIASSPAARHLEQSDKITSAL